MYFLDCLYEAMIGMADSATLLSSDPPHLERFLAQVSICAGSGKSFLKRTLLHMCISAATKRSIPCRRRVQCLPCRLLCHYQLSVVTFWPYTAVVRCLLPKNNPPNRCCVFPCSILGWQQRAAALSSPTARPSGPLAATRFSWQSCWPSCTSASVGEQIPVGIHSLFVCYF